MINGSCLRDALISAANNLQNLKASVDELNVFPVPDGDTGTNMSMTVCAARRELEQLPDGCTVAQTAQVTASAMLRGARGNSGVITSLLFRGFSKALAGKIQAQPQDIAAALASGVEAAYKAVMKPTEGTILTVARVASEKAAAYLAATQAPEMDGIWKEIIDGAEDALAHTPEQLPVLAKAGVVDAGGQGFCHILAGMYAVICGNGIIPCEEAPAPKKKSTANVGKGVFNAELNPDITNGYCTEFIVNKNADSPSADKLRAFLESVGDCVVVVEDEEIIKSHVHTADPGKVISHALGYGYLTNMKIENMHEQFEARQAEGKGLEKQAEAEENPTEFPYAAVDDSRAYGFVSVCAGEGLASLFGELGVDAVVSGGQTMNPSTDSILQAVQSVPAKTVFVLPNNKNIIMAAEQAAPLADRRVVVLPTRTVPQGVTAMLNFDPDGKVEVNQMMMMDAADGVSTGLITYAARNSDFDGHKIKKGEILALENGKLAFTDKEVEHAVLKLAKNMVTKNSSLVTLYSGEDVSEQEGEAMSETLRIKLGGNQDVTHVHGGQPVYYYMISVE